MQELELLSRVTLYVLLVLFGLITLILGWFQINVYKGKAMDNPDGSTDDWHEQKILFGMSLADIIIICPATFVGIALILIDSHWGFFILVVLSFWHVWVNTSFTVTSLRFEKPEMTFMWFMAYPFGILLGISYLIWIVVHFDVIFFP
ncbi:hypothetical protein LI82_00480 [Methanococcoides methylutens]|uniref:Uncharacterized protein n=1 Tax=Methanococcoides methylutens TaxID=2226 RepID=A0A099T3G2_METMT|nr:hypothetical protein [Methanococcoides methylutens]KGK99730.1 hypothetical protein LI82_00480 [Methanococcoides methylutens]